MKKISLPSLRESKLKIIREKCLATVLGVFMFVATFCTVAAFRSTTAYTDTSLSSNSNLESEAAQEEDNLTILVNNYILNLEEQGYKNISYSSSLDAVAASGDQEFFSNNFTFYADYCVLKINDTYYWFKTEQEANDFIEKLCKYGKQDYEKYNNVKEQIEEETSGEQLEKIILAKKIEAEEEARKRIVRKTTRYAASQTIIAEASKPVYSGDVTGEMIAAYAKQFVGNPYVWGGTSLTNGADCSGFVYRIFNDFGIEIPRTGHTSVGQVVSLNALQPGDIVFYSDTGYKITHEGIYIGDGRIIHASTPKGGIKNASVDIMVKMTARRVI